MAKKKTSRQPFLRFLFVLYCVVMIWLLFGRPYSRTAGLSYQQQMLQNINLQPLHTIRNYLYVLRYHAQDSLYIHCFINLAGNILLFIPAGYLLPRLWQRYRRFFRFLFTCLLAILAVEGLQLITLLGSFDVDDIILNLFGMILGYSGCILTRKH